jgi:UDP-N-acetylglucosamine acyltransferase
VANNIHPSVVISGPVDLGEGNDILPYTVLIGPLELGDGNIIGPHVTIGTPGQDTRAPRHDATDRRISIGSRNIIREYTAIQKPCYRDLTRIGDDCFLMQSVHIPHDALIEDKVVIAPMTALGGIVRVMEGASLGIACSAHQYTVVGPYAFVGMNSAITKNVKPFSRYVPRAPVSVNSYAIHKFGFDALEAEITGYVLHEVRPVTQHLLALVQRYEQLCEESGPQGS